MQRKHLMSDFTHLLTAEELERFPEDDWRYELVEGRLIRMSPVGVLHGATVPRILMLIGAYALPRQLGLVLTEVGFTLRRNPDTVRAPDIAFIRQDRVTDDLRRGFWQGAPDLAIEVLSPDDRPGKIRQKVDDYLDCGTSLVLVVDPEDETVTVYRRLAAPVTLAGVDLLDLDDVVPGFRCTAGEMFQQ
jgi:Uma2 family endonuclease